MSEIYSFLNNYFTELIVKVDFFKVFNLIKRKTIRNIRNLREKRFYLIDYTKHQKQLKRTLENEQTQWHSSKIDDESTEKVSK